LILKYNRKPWKKKFTYEAYIQSIGMNKTVLIQIGIHDAISRITKLDVQLGRCCPRVEKVRIITEMISV
jgi:hypothetical protein